MAFKLILLIASAIFATANAGVAVTSGSENTYRSAGNLAQVSTQAKTIDTPYSSSSKTDVRVSNPSVYLSAQPALAYSAQPAPLLAAAAPSYYEHQPAKFAYPAPGPSYAYSAASIAPAELHYPHQHHAFQAYAAGPFPADHQLFAPAPAPFFAKTATYAAPAAYHHVAQPASFAYPAPAALAQQRLVKVAYSPANEVAHLAYSNVNDRINYAW